MHKMGNASFVFQGKINCSLVYFLVYLSSDRVSNCIPTAFHSSIRYIFQGNFWAEYFFVFSCLLFANLISNNVSLTFGVCNYIYIIDWLNSFVACVVKSNIWIQKAFQTLPFALKYLNLSFWSTLNHTKLNW